jgi:alkyl hydroperoxide reductase subunit AhpF
LTPQDTQTIREHYCAKASPATISLVKGKAETGRQLSGFCEKFRQLAPHITIQNTSDTPFKDPAMVMGRHQNIAYHAIPTGKILPLFLESLDSAATEGIALGEDVEGLIDDINLPAGLKLYVAGQCPHCPHTLRKIQSLATRTEMIRLQIISVDLLPQWAQDDQVRSVPTLILDDEIRWTGQVSTKELLTMCNQRDPSQLSADALRHLIEDGRAAEVAAMMTERRRIFPALIELLTHQRWSVRLGAMVTAEYLTDEAPALGDRLCSMLWERFDKLPAQVQGDVVHLFGLVNTDEAKVYLQRLLNGTYDEQVIEAAAEVLSAAGGNRIP